MVFRLQEIILIHSTIEPIPIKKTVARCHIFRTPGIRKFPYTTLNTTHSREGDTVRSLKSFKVGEVRQFMKL